MDQARFQADVNGRILLPRGFRFAAVAAGIKYPGRLDLALAEAPGGAFAAALFTANRVKAAPLLVGARNLKAAGGSVRAIIVNSGNANCATGERGIRACAEVCAGVAAELDCSPEHILPSSTGVIGMPLPADCILRAVPQLVAGLNGGAENAGLFARAIMTTDTRPKMAGAQFGPAGKAVTILGVAKGAGMIHPNMATMLAYVFTDISARPATLRRLLKQACGGSFNAISVDGDTSTNDTLALMASGASGFRLNGQNEKRFAAALQQVCSSLAGQIVADGEGVRHAIRLQVTRARNQGEATRIAQVIATSLLVKTAWAGADPNWGRILAAIGRSGINLDPAQISIWFGPHQVCRGGAFREFDEKAAHEYMSQPFYDIRVSLGRGQAQAQLLTGDLTAEYVSINADYRS
ncbi:MAG: bifunctional glutamate N-acetyltransferase/amino-acid acetyltransferase ArgJ [Acidobacteria bacterium]|nr:bifunctional glutamate N-acetyltransferase/amino-acid acetyltransferase ArgJ [Acidobacteriota bacterium]